tara:strand:+ start:403 stop:825 length:423 start_codon:yes stop_codon:yes gene_type:complete
MKNILKFNGDEKSVILEMHKSATKKQYLNESTYETDMGEVEMSEQGIASKVKAGVNSVGKGLEKRKDMRQERNAAAKKERARGKVLSYNQDIVSKINQFINTLKSDDTIKSTFGGYIDYLDKVVKKDLNSKGVELKDMEI